MDLCSISPSTRKFPSSCNSSKGRRWLLQPLLFPAPQWQTFPPTAFLWVWDSATFLIVQQGEGVGQYPFAEKIMVHQLQQRKRMCHQVNGIYLRLPLLWMIFSIRMTRKEVIWKSSPNTYLVSLSPLSTTIIHAYLRCVVWLWGLPQLKEFQETGEIVRMSMKDMVTYVGGVFLCTLSPPS